MRVAPETQEPRLDSRNGARVMCGDSLYSTSLLTVPVTGKDTQASLLMDHDHWGWTTNNYVEACSVM